MCATCGCGQTTHTHAHAHESPHGHAHVHDIEHALLAKNDARAAVNRRRFADRDTLAINLLSSPGAGKTTILERTIDDLRSEIAIQVIEGDQATERDAERIRAAGSAAVQINTGTGCHLDAEMISRGLDQLPESRRGVVFIENVGNLVCPALFDLGEHAKVVVASVTEGEDKPLKYPHMFRACALVLLNKTDLLPHVRFDVERFTTFVHAVKPTLAVLPVSAERGTGLPQWYDWIRAAHGD
jgi:hydrogenase nickel incorporation protein HypB